jgi:predicted transcriptional regulator/transcriptional regulator with XRE-family HTH domain
MATLLGAKVRALRRRHGLTQVQLAERLGVSASYINLIEHNKRPLTANLLIELAKQFELDLASFSSDDDGRLQRDLVDAFADAAFDDLALTTTDIEEFVRTSPTVARAVRLLSDRCRAAEGALADHAGGLTDGAGAAPQLPSEEVSDLVQRHNNHFPELEAAAEQLWRRARLDGDDLATGLVRHLRDALMVDVRIARLAEEPGALRRFDRRRRELVLSEVLPPRSRVFQLAVQIALLEHRDRIDSILDGTTLSGADSRNLAAIALANYFAGAVMMPYEPFLEAAQRSRYDLELLGHRFRTSLEQIGHRVTSLSRPGAEGIPFHMVRVDIAGNISKKFTRTGIRFARFGAACSLWNVFQAFLTPGRFCRQTSVMPDGKPYFCVARTIPKGRGGYHAQHTLHALGLGCQLGDARQLVYADGIDLDDEAAIVPIGVSCRLCERQNCSQRAFPQVGRQLDLDPDLRRLSTFAGR